MPIIHIHYFSQGLLQALKKISDQLALNKDEYEIADAKFHLFPIDLQRLKTIQLFGEALLALMNSDYSPEYKVNLLTNVLIQVESIQQKVASSLGNANQDIIITSRLIQAVREEISTQTPGRKTIDDEIRHIAMSLESTINSIIGNMTQVGLSQGFSALVIGDFYIHLAQETSDYSTVIASFPPEDLKLRNRAVLNDVTAAFAKQLRLYYPELIIMNDPAKIAEILSKQELFNKFD